MINKKNLLFLFCDEKCSASPAIIPSLSRLADQIGIEFESYVCTRPKSWEGTVLPFTGNGHLQSFYYLANFYEKILYCSFSSYRSYQFRREVLAFGGEVISCRHPGELHQFYKEIYEYFSIPLPNQLTIIPGTASDLVNQNELWIAPYCYPDILFEDTIGISLDEFSENPDAYYELGPKFIKTLYCKISHPGFEIKCIDSIQANDNYGTITERIIRRHKKLAKGIGFGNPPCILRWGALYCREKIITLYQDKNWEEFVPTVAKYAKLIGNDTITGNQMVYPRNSDNVITEFARFGLTFDLVGLSPRIAFSVQKKHQVKVDWLEFAPTPWDYEYSDEELIDRIKQKEIPVCFILYAADLGHLPILPRILDLMSWDGMRAGIAFPSTWYEYQPELVEQIYIPLQQGGVLPNLEPMVSSVGSAVAPEAKGFIDPEMLVSLLHKTKKQISIHVGEKLVPRGYYSFQDANPFYKAGTGTPQYQAVSQAGFEYYISYKNPDLTAKVLWHGNGMTVINQTIPQWFPGQGYAPDVLKEFENQCINSITSDTLFPKAITFGFDTPFFALAPIYTGYSEVVWTDPANVGIKPLCDAMIFAKNGGDSGKLFLVKPHELYRYVQLHKKMTP
jgi:hypothetical protein